METKFKILVIACLTCFVSVAAPVDKPSSVRNRKLERLTDRADRNFNSLLFVKAVRLYERALAFQPSDSIRIQIAESYRLMNKPEKAVNWYEKVEDQDTQFRLETFRNYAESLAATERYDDARQMFQLYDQKNQESIRTVAKNLEGLEEIEKFYRDSAAYSVQNAFVNSEDKDFSPTYYKDGFVFVSSRGEGSQFLKPKYGWDQSLFLDLYYVSENSEREVEKFSRSLNSRFHEGPAAFYDDYNKIIFTRNNFLKGKAGISEDGVNKLKMYSSEKKKNGKWKRPVSFPYNGDNYSVGHPTITSDGKDLFFASDMPGGFGGADIYHAIWTENGWSQPENLGAEINTSQDELFPFFQENDSILYFASKGHPGLGGLDLFRTDLKDESGKVMNMGSPINTSRDDFGLVLDDSGELGYFSSNRIGGLGEDDIYNVVLFKYDIIVDLVDAETGELLEGDMNLIDSEVMETLLVQSKAATLTFEALNGHAFRVEGSMDGYENNHINIITSEHSLDKKSLRFKVPLTKVSKAVDMLIVENNLLETQVFKLAESIEEYSNSSDDMKKEFEVNEIYVVKNIYYDFDKYNIREDAAGDLDELATVLKSHADLTVELRSHTDSRGSNAYNETLSQNRAIAARDYLLNQGISEDRLSINHYGEEKLFNNCMDNTSCSSNSHQENRRTEIVLKVSK